MAKRKKTRSKKHTLGENEVQEEIIEQPKETFTAKKNIAKKIEKVGEKVKAAPQTYTEDTFDLEDQKSSEAIIENKIEKKVIKQISEENLYKLQSFKTKLTKIYAKVEYEKSFNFLLDFVTATKFYRRHYIDSKTDEFDLILYETTLHFKKRLTRINLPYKIYIEVMDYFEDLKNLYGQFKNSELVERDMLASKLDAMKDKSEFIKHYLF